ncbi:CubicO group peptidase, beta-lactamase class C family [Mucilaginibacter mallensis]|uniref:CubicO group peptidase, beta-lactamase class C family n=1 Tax=Mucilaginibacter mallensis TaxID=652787 RepID=A0A1H1R2D7_MUCMA|nr:serine hydrolase domain-containing protein [Mucilaginibacter mallensis]SDS29832.1 CubicO group peptidase, beta-lactamase class C family [Mucilaginibacter mallensis]
MRSARIFALGLVCLLLSISLNTMAQSIQQQKTDSVFKQVKKQFNAQQADSLYALAGAELKKALIIEAFRNIANNQLFPLGAIKQSTLISFENNKIATYKLVFSTGIVLQLLMSLDDEDKLQVFLFQPYKNPVGSKQVLAATSNPLKTITDKRVDSVARIYIQKANTVGLSIGVFKDGQISTYNYGETALGNGKLPTPNTIFEIGSITKTFTATILAYYVNEGKVKLNDPITKYLPDSVAKNPELKDITLQTLSNHTSGLPSLPDNISGPTTDSLNPYKYYTQKLLYAYLKTCHLKTKPGEVYSYSNMAVGLLGNILAHISGKTYEQLVAEIITGPLAMSSTEQRLTPLLAQRFATVYNEEGKPTPAWNFDAFAPCGALRSTVNNLLVYAKANMVKNDTKLSKAFELTHQITFNKGVKIGLGWHIITVNNVDYYFHNGGTYGSSSFLAFNAEKNIAIVVLSNCGESTDNVGVGILKKLQ